MGSQPLGRKTSPVLQVVCCSPFSSSQQRQAEACFVARQNKGRLLPSPLLSVRMNKFWQGSYILPRLVELVHATAKPEFDILFLGS